MIKSTFQAQLVGRMVSLGRKVRNQLHKGSRLDEMNESRELCCKVPLLGLVKVFQSCRAFPEGSQTEHTPLAGCRLLEGW